MEMLPNCQKQDGITISNQPSALNLRRTSEEHRAKRSLGAEPRIASSCAAWGPLRARCAPKELGLKAA
jgi:hypothetical protein